MRVQSVPMILAAFFSFLLGGFFLLLVILWLASPYKRNVESGLIFSSLMAPCSFLMGIGFIKKPEIVKEELKYLSYGALASLAMGYFAPANFALDQPIGASTFRHGLPFVWAERSTTVYRDEIVTLSSSYSLSFLWVDVVFWAVIIGLSVILYRRYRARSIQESDRSTEPSR